MTFRDMLILKVCCLFVFFREYHSKHDTVFISLIPSHFDLYVFIECMCMCVFFLFNRCKVTLDRSMSILLGFEFWLGSLQTAPGHVA